MTKFPSSVLDLSIHILENEAERIPWRSSGWDSVLPLQGARVHSLVGELGPHKLHGAAKKKS